MKKGEVANAVGITYNYLSTIFQKNSVDATMLEKLCVATGLHPMTFFEYGGDGTTVSYSDIHARTQIGSAAVNINHATNGTKQLEALLTEKDRLIAEKERVIAEKERMIQILLRQAGIDDGTNTRHTK